MPDMAGNPLRGIGGRRSADADERSRLQHSPPHCSRWTAHFAIPGLPIDSTECEPSEGSATSGPASITASLRISRPGKAPHRRRPSAFFMSRRRWRGLMAEHLAAETSPLPV